MKNLLIMTFSIIFLTSCTPVITTNSSLNDFVMMGTKTNSDVNVNYKFESKLTSEHTVTMGSFKPKSNVNAVFKSMLDEYMGSKFLNLNGNDLDVIVTLNSMEVVQNVSNDFGNVMAQLSSYGGEASVISKIKLSVQVSGQDIDETKIISASAEKIYNTSVNEGQNMIYAELMNKSYNKAIMQINAFLESVEL